jgi:heat shock protein HslJ
MWLKLLVAGVVLAVAACGGATSTSPEDANRPVATQPDPQPTTTSTSAAVGAAEGVHGRWRLVSGTLDGTQFANATTGGFFISIAVDRVDYPIDCNSASSQLEIDNGAFILGETAVTEMNCGAASETSLMFNEAFRRIDQIASEPPQLVLSGDGAELVFTRPEMPEDLGELPLTAAGHLLSFGVADGRQRTNQYLIVGSPDALGHTARYLLTTQTGETPASWQRWQGTVDPMFANPGEQEGQTTVNPTLAVTGPGPDTVLIPDDLHDGDYALCSPFWEPDPFCYTLRVRPPSAPWIVSAGPNGVVLHDANGTSEILSSEPTTIAFYVEGSLITQTTDQPDWIQIDETQVPLQSGETLLDVAVVDGRTLALVTGSNGSATIELDTGNRVAVGPQALEGRFGDADVILRTAPDTIEARDLDGDNLWETTIDPNAMVNPTDEGIIRLDTFRNLLPAGSGIPAPFYQYIATELLDAHNGQTIESYEEEVQIPDVGQNIGEPCGRTELRDDLLLCPQPDGRIVTLNGTITNGAWTATYARLGT